MRNIKQAQPIKTKKNLTIDIKQILGFAFFSAVIFLIIWLLIQIKGLVNDPEKLNLSQMTVTGDYIYTNESDLRNVIDDMGGLNTFVMQDVNIIQKSLLQLPWIYDASVRKQWPNKLNIHIKEFKPAYYWNEIYFLNNEGAIFSIPNDRINSKETEFLPKLYGPINKQKMVLSKYHQIVTILSNDINNTSFKVNKLITTERDTLQLEIIPCDINNCRYENEMTLKLGKEKIKSRLERFQFAYQEILKKINGNEKLKVIDLRYNNGLSISKE